MTTDHNPIADGHVARLCPQCRAKHPVMAAFADAHETACQAADYGAAVRIAHQMDIQQIVQAGYSEAYARWICDLSRNPEERPPSGKPEVDAEYERKEKAERAAWKAEAAQRRYFR